MVLHTSTAHEFLYARHREQDKTACTRGQSVRPKDGPEEKA